MHRPAASRIVKGPEMMATKAGRAGPRRSERDPGSGKRTTMADISMPGATRNRPRLRPVSLRDQDAPELGDIPYSQSGRLSNHVNLFIFMS
jgi:hypothetical protein